MTIALIVIGGVLVLLFLFAVTSPASYCPTCGKRMAAGMSTPLWYAGRSYCPNYRPRHNIFGIDPDA